MQAKLKLTALEKAVKSLRAVMALEENDIVRDAAIQRFEYTFELSWKGLKRFLKENSAVDAVLSAKNIFREGAKLGLIDDVDAWFKYLATRNLTSHVYNEDVAEETYEVIKQFLPDVETLLNRLQEANENST